MLVALPVAIVVVLLEIAEEIEVDLSEDEVSAVAFGRAVVERYAREALAVAEP